MYWEMYGMSKFRKLELLHDNANSVDLKLARIEKELHQLRRFLNLTQLRGGALVKDGKVVVDPDTQEIL